MVKHDCGSCRFFDQASDGKHGWCTHPERRESTSVRILVRAAELRCRNDWGQDQWQARTASDQVLGVVMNDEPAAPPLRIDRPQAPMVHPLSDSPAASRLTSAPLVAPGGESDQEESVRTVSDALNRELLRGAHARYRERQKNKGYSVPPERGPEPEPLIISNKYIPPSRDTGSTYGRGVTSSVFAFNARQSERSFDDVPDLNPPGDTDAQPVPESASASASLADPARRSDDDVRLPQTSDWTTEELFDAAAGEHQRSGPPDARVRPRRDAVVPRSAEARPAASERPDHSPLRAADLETWDVGGSYHRNENRGPWADIPRCCQTCRDFRPAGNGQRGWCNNQWAFRHRRMVDAHDIPCETSVGNWWIPGDEAWQGEFDIAAHGQPTPLVDKWFGRRSGDEESAGGTGERGRRRTGSW